MGLDFGIVMTRRGNDPIWTDETELAYGRKAWELATFFNGGKTEYQTKVTSEKWEELIRKLRPVGDKLATINEAFEEVNELDDDELDNIPTKQAVLLADYIDWYDKTWNEYPTLGYDFSAHYMLSFWNAKDKVRQILEDNRYDVYAIASY